LGIGGFGIFMMIWLFARLSCASDIAKCPVEWAILLLLLVGFLEVWGASLLTSKHKKAAENDYWRGELPSFSTRILPFIACCRFT
jgi:hypothetical protein